MLGRFGRDTGSLLGVEIAPDSVRMLQLHRQRGRWRVAGWAREPLDAISSDTTQVAKAVRQAHARCATRQHQVALALPASQVICKVCQLSAGTSSFAAEAQLLDQADQLFPFPLDDLALDFQVVGACAADPGKVDVLVAACRQSQLDPMEQLLAQAGLEVAAIEVDSIALWRALKPAMAGGGLIVQLEAHEVVAHRVLRGGVPQRQQVAMASPGQWLEAVEAAWPPGGEPVAEVVLVGAAASAARAVQLTGRLGIECGVLLPGPLEVFAEGSEAVAGAMVLACGLALGGLQ